MTPLSSLRSNVPRLSDSVTTIFGLFVVVRVEVDIMENDYIGSSEVDAETSSSRREEEDKDVAVRVVRVNQILSVKKNTKVPNKHPMELSEREGEG